VTQPTGEFSTDQTGREYMIECADLAMFTGSSADPAINEQVQQAIAAAGILNL
jgi:sucrose-6-phosphate hydrolase SacC (GH32 family)